MRTGLIMTMSALFLSACGGGDSPPATSPPATDEVASTSSSIRTADPDANAAATSAAATNLPRFGSVTQSSNEGMTAGVTGDAASTSFDGNDVRVTIDRTDGSSLVLNSATNRFGSIDYQPILQGYSYRGDFLYRQTNEAASLAVVYVNWDDQNPDDYLAGGYWLHAEGDLDAGLVTGVETGAFVDGPEIDGPATTPGAGQASYVGQAGGMYTYLQSGRSEIGEFAGDVRITADFGTDTVSGCVGCMTGIFVSGFIVDDDEQATAFIAVPSSARLRMGATPIVNGAFRSGNVNIERDDARVTSTDGSWGGRFSTIGDGQGPRLAAGTAGASWTEEGGGSGAVVGAWFGARK